MLVWEKAGVLLASDDTAGEQHQHSISFGRVGAQGGNKQKVLRVKRHKVLKVSLYTYHYWKVIGYTYQRSYTVHNHIYIQRRDECSTAGSITEENQHGITTTKRGAAERDGLRWGA